MLRARICVFACCSYNASRARRGNVLQQEGAPEASLATVRQSMTALVREIKVGRALVENLGKQVSGAAATSHLQKVTDALAGLETAHKSLSDVDAANESDPAKLQAPCVDARRAAAVFRSAYAIASTHLPSATKPAKRKSPAPQRGCFQHVCCA